MRFKPVCTVSRRPVGAFMHGRGLCVTVSKRCLLPVQSLIFHFIRVFPDESPRVTAKSGIFRGLLTRQQPHYAQTMKNDSFPTIRDLYPHLSEGELAKAEENLDRYLEIVLRIFERLEAERQMSEGKLTYPRGTLSSIPRGVESSDL